MSSPQTYQVVIQKLLGTEYFVNDYNVQAASLDDARLAGLAIVDVEKLLHRNVVSFVNMRVRLSPTTGQGTVYPLTGTGADAVDGYLPLFNVVRADFACDFGRPGRKYYRLPIPIGGQSSGILGGTYRSDLQAIANQLITGGYGLCKPNGQPFIAVAIQASVGMHQLRRGSRKRTQPII
jgi:hypothetical protein